MSFVSAGFGVDDVGVEIEVVVALDGVFHSSMSISASILDVAGRSPMSKYVVRAFFAYSMADLLSHLCRRS